MNSQLFHAATCRLSRCVAGLVFTTALTGCMPSSPSNRTEPPNSPVSLTVSAAASLQNALSAIDPLFEQDHPDIEVSFNSGGSGTLQRQIEQGAPADIFFSASPLQMDALAEKGLIRSDSRQDLLSNQLVLIAPLASAITQFEDLRPESSAGQPSLKIAVGEFNSVPAGQYAQATLTDLKLLPQLVPQLVFFSNVRGVLAAVESGNAGAGLVYQTDAQLSAQVKVVAIAPQATHPPILYPIAILERSQHPEAAQQYIDFLTTPAANQVFQQFGFITPTQ